MPITPPQSVVDAIDEGGVTITRRLEVTEQDGVTPWEPDEEALRDRFIEGAVNIDYSRDERRTIDVTLRNSDGLLRPTPYGGLWYDKVIRPFRGVRFKTTEAPPRMVIVEESVAGLAQSSKAMLNAMGFTNIDIRLNTVNVSSVLDYDFVISISPGALPTKSNLLKQAYNAGKHIITWSGWANENHLPFVITASASSIHTVTTTEVSTDVPIQKGWGSWSTPSSQNIRILSYDLNTAIALVTAVDGALTYSPVLIAENPNGGRWFHYGLVAEPPSQAKTLWQRAITWQWNRQEYTEWEIQTGEFVIDNINDSSFPSHVKVVGRDYTKRCMHSKLERAKSFEKGYKATDVIRSLAANARCYKINIPSLNFELPKRLDYAAGTPRWQIMKEIANSFGYDIFFDHRGYLSMVTFADPAFSAVTATFLTGTTGNLLKIDRSVSDSELYNHIVITSSSEGSDGSIPFFGEAINNIAGSPTSVDEIGDRVYSWSSVAIDSDDQAAELARAWLKVYALESYELQFDSIVYPWLDVGSIGRVIDPKALDHEPDKYLLSTINIPFSLAPMSISGRRVVTIQDSLAVA